jgi:hypothetical protein
MAQLKIGTLIGGYKAFHAGEDLVTGKNTYLQGTTTEFGKSDGTTSGILKLWAGAGGVGKSGKIEVSNGNMHIDSNAGHNILLNYYSGNGTVFGNGASGQVAYIDNAGVLHFGSSADTNLFRDSANYLRTNDSFIVDSKILVGTTANPTNAGAVLRLNGGLEFTLAASPAFYADSEMRFLTTGNNAQGVKVGSLTVSSDYGNSAPTNGIYSKGAINVYGGINSIISDGNLSLDTPSTGQYANIYFKSAGTTKWWIGKDTSDNFVVTSQGVGTFLTIDRASGAFSSKNNVLDDGTGQISIANGLKFSTASDGQGIDFWGGTTYRIYMSSTSSGTWGGRLDSTSDFNMYFKMAGGGTNRGFVFNTNNGNVAQIDSTGNLFLKNTNVAPEIIFNGSGSVSDGQVWGAINLHQGTTFLGRTYWAGKNSGKPEWTIDTRTTTNALVVKEDATVAKGKVQVQATASNKRYSLEYNATEDSLDIVYYAS